MSDSRKNLFQDILLLLLICYAFNVPAFVSLLLTQNFGVPPLPYTVEATLALPVFLLLLTAFLKKDLKLPYFGTFLLVEGLFLLLESGVVRDDHVPELRYPYGLFILYSVFLGLINYGTVHYDIRRIKRFSLGVLFLLVATVYLGYMGFLDLRVETSEFALGHLASSRPIGHIFHANGLSFHCSVGIYLLIFSQLAGFDPATEWKFWMKTLSLLSIIIINASMGAFLIAALGVCFYLLKTWHQRGSLTNLLVIYIIVFFFLDLAFPSDINVLEKFFIYNRVHEEAQFNSRIRQVYVTWVNFVNNPWLGLGYYDAARGVIAGYTRSNFHYTQILASNGIFYFFIYMTFLWKMFGFRDRRAISLLCTAMGFSALMFYNFALIMPLAIIAYAVYRRREEMGTQPAGMKASPALVSA